MKKKKIKIPIYFGKLILHKVKWMSELNEKYNLNASDDFDSFVFQETSKKVNKKYHVVLKENTSGSIIAHEVVHLVNYIFLHNGIELDRHNDEPQAYLTGWLFKQIETFKNQES